MECPRDLLERISDVGVRIEQWAVAYPLSVFPEPDLKKAAQALEAAGMTLDGVSASNMRHVATQIEEMISPLLVDVRRILDDDDGPLGEWDEPT